MPADLLGVSGAAESSAAMRARVVAARARQADRLARDRARTNAELAPALVARHCALDRAGLRVLEVAVRRLALSARAYDRERKVARTIADLAAEDGIAADHVAEALQFRMVC